MGKVGAQHPGTGGAQPSRLQVVRAEGAHDGHLGPCAGRRDVEPPLAVGQVQRAESVQHPPVRGATKADRQHDGVALVALHLIDALDEEPLCPVIGEEPGQIKVVRLLGELVAQGVVDPHRVPPAQRDYAEGLRRPTPGMINDQVDDPGHLGVGALDRILALNDRPSAVDLLQRQDVGAEGAGERDHRAVVHSLVHERDQALVQRAIVPAQVDDGQNGRQLRKQRLCTFGHGTFAHGTFAHGTFSLGALRG